MKSPGVWNILGPRTVVGMLMLLAVLLPGCATDEASLNRFEYRQIIMGVEAGITLYSTDPARAREAAREAFGRMIELDAVMSDYREDSELSRLCRQPAGRPIPVSADLFGVLERSLVFASATDGAFDPTVGRLSQLWRVARRNGRLPDPGAIGRARATTGWWLLELDEQARTATRVRDGTALDLGGIGKGYAADAALSTLRGMGAPRALIDLGGDLVAGDPPPGRDAWMVAIDSGMAGADQRRVRLANAAIATSGDAEQFLEIDGVRYAHIIDPRTGCAVRNASTVTVIATDATTADALASALSVLGPVQGLDVLDGFPDAEARFEIRVDGAARFVSSDGFPAQSSASRR
jgi:thiamine biosynthesis lipoprotein